MSDKKEKIVAVKGMNDILPAEAPLWELFENTVAVRAARATATRRSSRRSWKRPALFARAIGAVTDIVEKEMYSFTDSMNGDQLTLRPEGTAGVVRAVIEHNLVYDGPQAPVVQGPDVPPRASAARPLPPVPPVRRRSGRLRRARTSTPN